MLLRSSLLGNSRGAELDLLAQFGRDPCGIFGCVGFCSHFLSRSLCVDGELQKQICWKVSQIPPPCSNSLCRLRAGPRAAGDK